MLREKEKERCFSEKEKEKPDIFEERERERVVRKTAVEQDERKT